MAGPVPELKTGLLQLLEELGTLVRTVRASPVPAWLILRSRGDLPWLGRRHEELLLHSLLALLTSCAWVSGFMEVLGGHDVGT